MIFIIVRLSTEYCTSLNELHTNDTNVYVIRKRFISNELSFHQIFINNDINDEKNPFREIN